MKITTVLALRNKMRKEAEKAVDKIYRSYDEELNSLISRLIPEGMTLGSINGEVLLLDKNDNVIEKGNGDFYKILNENQEVKLADLQYSDKIYGSCGINREIKGTKIV